MGMMRKEKYVDIMSVWLNPHMKSDHLKSTASDLEEREDFNMRQLAEI